jgi:hypothetical protein
MRAATLAAAVAACGGGEPAAPNADKLHAQLAPLVEPKLKLIEEQILKQPLPAPTETIEVTGPPLRLIFDLGSNEVGGNTLYAFDDDLRSIERYQRNPLRYNFSGELVNDCFMIVRKKMFAGGDFGMSSRDPKPWTGDEHIVGMKLPRCAALRYLVVIKLDAFKDTDYIDKESFGAGGAIAQAHVFDLEAGGKHAGGVSFRAESSSHVRGGDTTGDLRENFYKALKVAVGKHLPNAQL